MRRQIVHVLLQIIQALGVDGVEFFLGLPHLFFDELFGGRTGVDGSFGLLVDVLAGEFGGHGLGRFRIAAAISDVESVGDVIAAGVDFDLDLLAHLIDEQFRRLAAQALFFEEVVLFHQWLQRAAAGDDLRYARQLAGERLFGDRRHHRIRQRRRLNDDQGGRLIDVRQTEHYIGDGEANRDRRQQD